MSDLIFHKRGSAFSYVGTWTPGDGDPVTLEDVTITSQIRKQGLTVDVVGDVVADLVITKSVDFMKFYAKVVDTSLWPLEHLEWDIKFVINGMPAHTQTMLVSVIKAQTA
jgi:hypothetical protein